MSEKENFDWKRMLLRKDRPLPKAGCSWAFYIVLLLMVIYLIVMFVKYQKQL
ncbi:MAG: hypothetical protein IKP34_04810 [Bacteroidales bacterium]|jgi:hypothetical protein|nr:hypothetical protein [Bacteroidales bacterium]MBR4715479.1 hypothetical protein [Bacteroidales bacterium]